MVRDVTVQPDGSVEVTIALTVAGCPMRVVVRGPGAALRRGGRGRRLRSSSTSSDEPGREGGALVTLARRPAREDDLARSATRVLAIASGKGGVGKSTLTANLAAALGGARRAGRCSRRRRLRPLDPAHARRAAAPGRRRHDDRAAGARRPEADVDRLLPRRQRPVMWRGPMLHRALEQFLSDVYWGELDTLVVDMPPGTGDVAISLGQLLPRAEVVIVTTPQPAAQQVAVRAAGMAEKVGHADRRRRREHVVPRRNRPGDLRRRAVGSASPTRSGRRCSAACRSTRRCAKPADAGHADLRSGARRGGDGGDRRARRAAPEDAPRAIRKPLTVLLLEKHRETKKGARRRPLSATRAGLPL